MLDAIAVKYDNNPHSTRAGFSVGSAIILILCVAEVLNEN